MSCFCRHFNLNITYQKGLDFFAVGSPDTLCDWVHGDNLVHGLLLCGAGVTRRGKIFCIHPPLCAYSNLLLYPDALVCGRAFPISDAHPLNNFEFIRQILGDPKLFWFYIPTNVVYMVAFVLEFVHHVLKSVGYVYEPYLTRTEVCKIGYTHYFSMDGPRKRLGYVPLLTHEEGIRRARRVFAPQLKSRAVRRKIFIDFMFSGLISVLLYVIAIVVMVWVVLLF